MPDIATPLNAAYNGAVCTAEQVADTTAKVIMTADERARLMRNTLLLNNATGGTANALVVTTFPPSPITSGQLAILRPLSGDNSGPVTVAIDGGGPIPLYDRKGAALVAGALKSGGHYLVRVAGAGETLQLVLLGTVEAPAAPSANDGDSYMSPRRTIPLVAKARVHVTGRIYALTPASGKVTISASQGRIWTENNAGGPAYKIAPITSVDIPNGQSLMVDMDAALNGSGQLDPFIGNPAASANTGWQTGNKLVLFSNWNSNLGVAPDQIYGGGAYVLDLPIPDMTALSANILRARRSIDGRVYKLNNNLDGTVTVALSQGRVWKENNSGVIDYRIEAVPDVTLAANQAIVADLDSLPNGNGRIVPAVVTNLAAGENAGWQSGNKIVLFSHTTSSSGATVDQIYGGGAYKLDLPRVDREPQMMVVKVAPGGGNGAMSINIPASGKANQRWTSWRFLNSVNVGINCNVWRCAGCSDVTLDASYNATTVQQLTRTSELEVAVLQDGKADYSGGVSHGNQVKSEFRALADGKEFDPNGTLTLLAKTLDFYQTSALYEYGNSANKIADIYTHWRWTSRGLRLDETMVVADPTAAFRYIYLGMFPVYRNNGTIDLVTKGRRSVPVIGQYEEDLSTSGYAETRTKANEMIGYGAGGYLFRATKLQGWDDNSAPNRKAYFSPGVDNKFYFNQVDHTVGGGFTFAAGTVIGPVVTEFEILNPN